MKILLTVLLVLVSSRAAEPVQFLPNGEILFSDVPSQTLPSNWDWKPTRWGMHDVWVNAMTARTEVTIGTNRFQASGKAQSEKIGRFYLNRAEPRKVTLEGARGNLRLVPAPEGGPIIQNAGDSIVLHSRDCTIHGVTLRYEPQTNKICIGYWSNAADYPAWDFVVATPGMYEVQVLQGCGKGHGGSEAQVICAGQKLPFTVIETGHFQNFTNHVVGVVNIARAGALTLQVKALSKKAGAVMDIRQVTLRPLKGGL